ncbi:MAG TPA: FtsX-like permease family protein, partial [Acidimicrobiia bacterium]|nr:FtsX-like permease family protein [Acidimicrobiia bacterium]
MGQATLVARLASRDLRRRPAEAVLLLLAIVAAMATLTVGLAVRDLAAEPFQSTREATLGPDVVAFAGPPPSEAPGLSSDQPTDVAILDDLIDAEGVVGHSGPFPVANVEMSANGESMDAQAVGRDEDPASIDQPLITRGGWVEEGGVVVEAAFAGAKDLSVGDQVSLNSQPFEVVGIAVTAASAPYPETVCLSACVFGASDQELAELQPPSWMLVEPGLVWVTRTDAEGLVSPSDPMPHVVNLQLEDPDTARDFVDAHVASEPSGYGLISWQEIFERSARRVRDTQRVFLVGSALLILMAMATVAVLVAGRMADQSRRVGLLKAVGATPQLVAAVLLTEYVVVALLGAGAGLLLGWLIAPLLIEPSVGLIGAAAPGLTVPTIAVVTGVALLVAATATM